MDTSRNNASDNSASRVEATGWGLLLMMTGVLALIPAVPAGSWLVGVGVLLLGLNVARRFLGLATDRLGVVLGTGAALAGLGTMAGLDVPLFPLLIVACGLAIIAGQVRAVGSSLAKPAGSGSAN